MASVYSWLRPLLFRLPAEIAHEFALRGLALAPGWAVALARRAPPPELACSLAGLRLRSPVGLAAGLDKNGLAIPFWPALGFGFVEVGTVTAHPQPGNPKPRLFRLVEDRAVINRMGFNNAGSEALARRLRRLREAGQWPEVPVGVNVGKSKVTPIEEATGDYVTSITRLRGLADYFTVNVSSPNTPGLRTLQEADALQRLLPAAVEAAAATPVFLKLAPDLSAEALEQAVELAVGEGIAGIIATNTTIRRDGLRHDPGEAGGLSGRPLWAVSRPAIATVLAASRGRVPVIGVGGVDSFGRALDLLTAGCAAIQVYTALIYEGAGFPARLNRQLARRCVV